MPNTPKLPEDVEKRLKSWSEDPDGGLCADFTTEGYGYYDELKQFLAQELAQAKQEQKEADAKMAEGMKKKDCGWTGHGVLPKHMGDYEQIQAAKVYGYISGCTDIAKAIREGE